MDTTEPGSDESPLRAASRSPETPEGFETMHKWLFRAAAVFFVWLALDAFCLFPYMLIRWGWQ
jgi:hypothetical protein